MIHLLIITLIYLSWQDLKLQLIQSQLLFPFIWIAALEWHNFYLWIKLGIYIIFLYYNHTEKKLGNGDIDLVFVVSLWLSAWQWLIWLTLSCFLAIFQYQIFSKAKIPFVPALTISLALSVFYF
ncbi:prepilin peptidase [Weissella kandleri]|uniref:prepilin peptidase n=1 Tax=Weissella kandleri TaxID=1616 RepID=UPI00387E2B00